MKNAIIITLAIAVLYFGVKSSKNKKGGTGPVVDDAYDQAMDAARKAVEKITLPDHLKQRLMEIINGYDNPDSKKYFVEKSLRSSKDLMQLIIDEATGTLKKLGGSVNPPAGTSGGGGIPSGPAPIPNTGASMGMG